MNKYSLFLICILSFSSCVHITSEQDKSLHQMQSEVESLLSEISNIDSSRTFNTCKHFSDNISYVKNEMKDTITTEMGFYIDRYYAMRKSFKLFTTHYSQTLRELKLLENQLMDLRHDAEKGILSSEEVSTYIRDEKNHLLKAEEKVVMLMKIYNIEQPKYDSLNPRIDSLVMASKAKLDVEG